LDIALSAKIAKIRVATPTQAPKISKKTVQMFDPLGWAIPPLWLAGVAEWARPVVELPVLSESGLALTVAMTMSLIGAARAGMDCLPLAGLT
jgi:hypothetical protein